MQKKLSFTIVERAIIAVPGFEKVAEKLSQEYDYPPGICLVHCA